MYKINKETLELVLAFLSTQPYNQVARLINDIQKAQPLGGNEQIEQVTSTDEVTEDIKE